MALYHRQQEMKGTAIWIQGPAFGSVGLRCQRWDLFLIWIVVMLVILSPAQIYRGELLVSLPPSHSCWLGVRLAVYARNQQ